MRRNLITLESQEKNRNIIFTIGEHFKIRNNYVKTFKKFNTRVLAKLTALTLVQYINKFISDCPISNIKNQII